ncbi:ASCH domain-containing protein [Nocardioides limicola]|uniref:ASCH domain-containing protein n=1 Tax=Nocardioides limicola TaxID=2803368 RepID=UPI00193AE6D6|nr:ASCH domain-containing protein [Nocardioides sp. DJM-14]
MTQDLIDSFWQVARVRANLNRLSIYTGPQPLDAITPPAWAFGATPEHADELLALVLAGTKTATSTALWDIEADPDEPMPERGGLSILLDGSSRPRALIVTSAVSVVPFDEVDADHARAEGEGDRTLEHWSEVHQRFFTEHAAHDRGFSPTMPVVLERFEVLYDGS